MRKTTEEILSIAERLAKRKGVDDQEAQDIAQTIALKFYLAPSTGQTIGQAITDYLRESLGDSRSTNPRKRLAESWDYPPEIPAPERALYGDLSRDEIELLDSFKLKSMQRAAILLKFALGMAHKEIAFLFGVSTVRVTQIIGEALTVMESRHGRE